MDTTNSLLDRLATKHGGCTDYRLAKILQVNSSAISNYRNGRSCIGEEVALKVAAELGLSPGYVLACAAAERAPAAAVRKAWEELARRAATVGAAAFGLLLLLPDAAHAASVAGLASVTSSAGAGVWLELLFNQALAIYILCAL